MNRLEWRSPSTDTSPKGWARGVPRTSPRTGRCCFRVLVVEDLPPVAFTSVLPVSRRRYGAALAAPDASSAMRCGHGCRDTARPVVASPRC
jgi:hypothetical protein